jgi:hypothetical protein
MPKEKSILQRYIKWSIAQKKKNSLTCQFCREKKKKSNELVCHHIIPIKKSGVNTHLLMDEGNIIVLCHDCHNMVHGKTTMSSQTTGAMGLGTMGGSIRQMHRHDMRQLINGILTRHGE